MKRALLVLALIAVPAAAQDGPQPFLADGETIEAETRADLNGDDITDLAYVVSREDARELRVVTSVRSEVDIGENPVQVLALDAAPLIGATLALKGTVLLLKDLTGGTTAVASTHRFRWDGQLAAMQLIGLDATLYSRTFAHDGREASWNLLTGDAITRTLRLLPGSKDAAYEITDERRIKKPSAPIRLEDSPSGDDLLGWPQR